MGPLSILPGRASMNRLVAILAVVGGLLAAPVALASSSGELTVDDKAGVFTSEGIKKAEEAFHGTTFKAPTHMTVVSYAKVPEAKRAQYEAAKGNANERKRFFRQWAEELASARHARGPYVLISM